MPFFPGNFSCIQWYLMSASRPLAASSLRLLACRLRGCCLVLYSWAAVAASTPTSLEASKRLFGCRYVRGLRRVPRQRTSWAKRKNPPKIGLKNPPKLDWSYLCMQQFSKFWIRAYEMTGNGNYVNMLQPAWKNSWIKFKFNYSWQVLEIWNHCAPPLCSRATSSTFTEKEKASIENKSILDQEPSQTSFPEK